MSVTYFARRAMRARRIFRATVLGLLTIAAIFVALGSPLRAAYADDAPAAAAAAAAPAATIEQRLANLEAYVVNRAPDPKVEPLGDKPGPGHNGWLMTSSALVLFMTLPGLALFYGGLVRRKNVLSVVAQCFGTAGLVTILWWAIGYSVAFAQGSALLGGLDFAMFQTVTAVPNPDYATRV